MTLLQLLKSKIILFGLLLAAASIIQTFVPFLPAAYVGIVGSVVSAAVI